MTFQRDTLHFTNSNVNRNRQLARFYHNEHLIYFITMSNKSSILSYINQINSVELDAQFNNAINLRR